jgi:hypothetical protein
VVELVVITGYHRNSVHRALNPKWMEGRFLWTLVATDMATGWSECLPLPNRCCRHWP